MKHVASSTAPITSGSISSKYPSNEKRGCAAGPLRKGDDDGGVGGTQFSEREMLEPEATFLKEVAMERASSVGLPVLGSQSAM